MADQVLHQEMVRKKVLATKGNLVLVINQNHLVLQTILSTLEKKYLKAHQLVERKKTPVLMERRSLKAEVTDLKVLPSKSTVKKELKSKTF